MVQYIYKSNQAYELLEELITLLELPPGEMVSESKLVDLTGLGRSPVREALQRLSFDKMVEIFPSKGILIKPISVEDQIKLLEVRRCIGELAIRLSANRGAVVHKKEMKAIIESLKGISKVSQIKELIELLKRIHRVTVESTQNEYIDLVLSPLQGLARRFWYAHLNGRDKEMVEVANLYSLKLQAICVGDEKGAVSASLNINGYFTNYTYQTLSKLVL